MRNRLLALIMAVSVGITSVPTVSVSAALSDKAESDITYNVLSDEAVSKMDKDTKKEYKSLLEQLEAVNATSATFGMDSEGNIYLEATMKPTALFVGDDDNLTDDIDKEIVYESNPSGQNGFSENMECFDLSWINDLEDVTYYSASKDDEKEFDTYFYNQINDISKKYFEAGYESIIQNKGVSYNYSCELNTKKTGVDEYVVVGAVESINALVCTYPLCFEWLDRGTMQLSCTYKYNPKTKIYDTFVSLGDKSQFWSQEIEDEAVALAGTLASKAKEYAEKNYPDDITYGETKYFNEWLVDNNYYNYDGTDMYYAGTEEYYNCHVGYGCLLKGYGVCESYALAMKRLLDEAGIENQYVVGYCSDLDKYSTGHAWNYVKMKDGYYYLLDSTWNDNDVNHDAYFVKGSHVDAESLGYRHIPEGNTFILNGFFGNISRFSFEDLAYEDYGKEHIISANILEVKKSESLDIDGLKEYVKKGAKFESSNTDVVSVNKKGKLKAKSEGEAIISVTVDGMIKKYSVNTYKLKSLCISGPEANNGEITISQNGITNIELTVNKGDKTSVLADSIRDYREKVGKKLVIPKAKSSKKKVLTVDDIAMIGDRIIVRIAPQKIGKAKVKVSFGKTKISLKVNVS